MSVGLATDYTEETERDSTTNELKLTRMRGLTLENASYGRLMQNRSKIGLSVFQLARPSTLLEGCPTPTGSLPGKLRTAGEGACRDYRDMPRRFKARTCLRTPKRRRDVSATSDCGMRIATWERLPAGHTTDYMERDLTTNGREG